MKNGIFNIASNASLGICKNFAIRVCFIPLASCLVHFIWGSLNFLRMSFFLIFSLSLLYLIRLAADKGLLSFLSLQSLSRQSSRDSSGYPCVPALGIFTLRLMHIHIIFLPFVFACVVYDGWSVVIWQLLPSTMGPISMQRLRILSLFGNRPTIATNESQLEEACKRQHESLKTAQVYTEDCVGMAKVYNCIWLHSINLVCGKDITRIVQALHSVT